jgi:Tfp pilus assembly protein PilN
MAASKPSIEFLPKEDWEKGIFGSILKWALSFGRHVVYFTELIVILGFLSRFKLDRDLTNLGEKIKQQQAIIDSSSLFEKDFRFLQKRLSEVENLRKDQLEAEATLTELASLIPLDVSLSDLNVSTKEVSLTATSLSEQGLKTFLNNLKKSPRFTDLALSEIGLGLDKEIGIRFVLRGEVKN